jgi:Asp-tRNA(Asn)/Glu-tRNA(Gln) amidotransferase A subunit family amidase
VNTYHSRLGDVAPELRFGRRDLQEYYDTVTDRIVALDDEIHAFVDGSVTDDRITHQLTRLTDASASQLFPPPLYGVPVGVKDVFHVDGFPTRAGASVPPDALAGSEGTVIRRLRDAGAVLVGKTATTEFTHLPTGDTRNPRAPNHTPGGSSSGSAAAVAAGLCPLALGTETTGSVVRPAAFCGVVGFRPSAGRLPTDGTVSLAPTADTVGLFTQDLGGVGRVAPLLCDNWTTGSRPDWRPTVGIPDDEYLAQASPTGRELFGEHVAALESAGFETQQVQVFPDVQRINELHGALLAAEAAGVHAEWYTRYPERYSTAMVELIERGEDVSIETVGRAKESMRRTRASVVAAFDSSEVNALVAPPAPDLPPEGLDDDGDPVMNLPWTHAGVPVVTLPVESTDAGQPVGIACVGRFGRDESLLGHSQTIREALSTPAY